MGWCLQAALNLGRWEEGTGGWAGSHFCSGEHHTSPDTCWVFCLCCPGGAAALQQHSLALLSVGAQGWPECCWGGLCLPPQLQEQALVGAQAPKLCCKRARNLKLSAEVVTKASESIAHPQSLVSSDMLLAFNREHTTSSAQAVDVFQGIGLSPFLHSSPREFKVSWPPPF